jgi:purine nucleosidase
MKEDINTPLSHFAVDCNYSALEASRNWLGDPGLGLPDPVAMAIAIDPTICTRMSKHYVEVECDGTYTRGMTVVDGCNVTSYDTANVEMWQPLVKKGEPNVNVCWELDNERWKDLLYKTTQA